MNEMRRVHRCPLRFPGYLRETAFLNSRLRSADEHYFRAEILSQEIVLVSPVNNVCHYLRDCCKYITKSWQKPGASRANFF